GGPADDDPVAGGGARPRGAGERGGARRGAVAGSRQGLYRPAEADRGHRPQARRRPRRRRRSSALAAAGCALLHRPGDPRGWRTLAADLRRRATAWNGMFSAAVVGKLAPTTAALAGARLRATARPSHWTNVGT